MHRTIKFRQGDPVIGFDTNRRKIIGIYRGVRSSFGVIVRGRPEHTEDEIQDHICLSLTLEHAKVQVANKTQTRQPGKFYAGDLVKATTVSGQRMTGYYMNKSKSHAWVRGWINGESKLSPKTAFKVHYVSLQHYTE